MPRTTLLYLVASVILAPGWAFKLGYSLKTAPVARSTTQIFNGYPQSEFDLSPSNPSKSELVLPPGFQPAEPQPLTVTGDWGTVASASFALALRLGCGTTVVGWRPEFSLSPPPQGEYALQLGPVFLSDSSAVLRGECPRPEGRLILYEFDSSPFCRKVRDACAYLDLEVLLLPCPGALEAAGFSDEHFAKTGRRTVPYFIDEGAGTSMFESEVIVNYLFRKYGPPGAEVPAAMQGTVALVSAGAAAIARLMPAAKLQVDARQDNPSRQPLLLYGYESSPFVRPVREKLCALGLPHVMVNSARGSVQRKLLMARTRKQFQVPYLVDPNTGVEMFESIDIRKYLDKVYTTTGYTPLE